MTTQTPYSSYSILLTVYAGDDPAEFETALKSCLEQTYLPEEVLVVADGLLTDELDAVLDKFMQEYPNRIKRHQLVENCGRGEAARQGLRECTHEYVGIMSADDISVPDRFERQVRFLDEHSNVDVVGGYVAEFSDDPDDPDTVRTVPTDHGAIERLARFRSPLNEVTVMFRREVVIETGNYRTVDRMEDYDLWVRLLQDGATFTNLPCVLVKMRADDAMFARRGGIEYAREEFRQQLAFFRLGFIGTPRLIFNLAVRVPIRFFPNRVRSWLYRRFLRNKPDEAGTV